VYVSILDTRLFTEHVKRHRIIIVIIIIIIIIIIINLLRKSEVRITYYKAVFL
jgi:hypothetical protein